MRPQPDCWFVVVSLSTFSARLRVGSGELAGVLDEAAEDGVGDAGHGGENGRRGDLYIADGEAGGDARVLGHGVLGGRVPAFLLEGVALFHRTVVSYLLSVVRENKGLRYGGGLW